MDIGARATRIMRRLGFRVAAFLSVALLPVGLIAVMQTEQVGRIAQQRSELTLLALTEQAALAERREIQRALGAAEALAAVVPSVIGDPAACAARMREFVGSTGSYSFAGYVPTSGLMDCSSTGTPYDFSAEAYFVEALADPRVRVTVDIDAPISRRSVLIASHPVFTEAGFAGYVSISLPHEALEPAQQIGSLDDSLELVTVNARGEALTGPVGLRDAQLRLPARDVLAPLLSRPSDVAVADDGLGRERVFAVVPIVQDEVFAIGSWNARSALVSSFGISLPAWTFPIIMWLVSLAVAYVAVHRLVIRHMVSLQKRMREFARDRHARTVPTGADMPAEIVAMEDDFADMTGTILRDEAKAEDRLMQQKVLLKEVHHRVKNNLQLISSIVNMQLRQLESPEARDVLSRVQDRVLGLAAIHRRLYQAPDMAGIDAAAVLREIVDQLAAAEGRAGAPEVRYALSALELYPDQAVPLSLFVTEAAANAIEHLGAPGDGTRPWIEVALEAGGDGEVELRVANSLGPRVSPRRRSEGAGLGTQLMRAFAAQLGGEMSQAAEGDRHVVALRFHIEGFESADMPRAAE